MSCDLVSTGERRGPSERGIRGNHHSGWSVGKVPHVGVCHALLQGFPVQVSSSEK